MKKILIAIDGSKYSDKALFKAKKIAAALEAEVTLLHVINPLKDTLYANTRELSSELTNYAMKHGEEVIQKAKEIFEGFQGQLNTIIKTGDTVDEIVRFAEDGGYDLIILGSRGAGIFSRTLLGSVSDKVVHHSKVSVLIVK